MSNERKQYAQPADPLSESQRVRVSIARAKFEWETTVDVLADLICLLDSAGRVTRVNRVVERWNLGSMTGVLGRDLHGLLHDDCSAESCSLQAALRTEDSGARSGEVREFEISDALLGRALHVTLRPMSASGEATVGNDCYAVAIVAASCDVVTVTPSRTPGVVIAGPIIAIHVRSAAGTSRP